jgi:hypothetical protein
MAAMKTTGVCLCDSPLRFDHGYCGRCWNRQFATVERTPRPPSGSAVPVPTAGAGRPSTPSPAASSKPKWTLGAELRRLSDELAATDADPADDYAEAYNDADTARIGAIFEKRTGRP